ncbi:MAG: threonine synthase [Tenacibaculum sp.]
MYYYSLNKKLTRVSFKQAVIEGLASDRGLYFPVSIPRLPVEFIKNIGNYSNCEIAYQIIEPFVANEIPSRVLREIIEDTLHFDFPLFFVDGNTAALELFHGPTLAFKDVGARFMACCLKYFKRNSDKKVTVLVATSGDTGAAVARGFLGIAGVEVVILYPSGKVSNIQEKQLCTLGQNITALEVKGTFDDCQNMVKTAFLDRDIKGELSSANSINIARWLPQMFYYFFAYKQLFKQQKDLVFSVPSGNFGNICAGMMAQKLGLPAKHFIAATNINNTVSDYLASGVYKPKPSKATISNAMDVGNPSNFVRIEELYNRNLDLLKDVLSCYSFTDDQTRKAIKTIYNNSTYIADPHGAVGYLGAKEYQKNNPNSLCVFLETAHPAKFLEQVESILKIQLSVPEQIKLILNKQKKSIPISSYIELKAFLSNKSSVINC